MGSCTAGSEATSTENAAPRDQPVSTARFVGVQAQRAAGLHEDLLVLDGQLRRAHECASRTLDLQKRARTEAHGNVSSVANLAKHVHSRAEPAAIAARVEHDDVIGRRRSGRVT